MCLPHAQAVSAMHPVLMHMDADFGKHAFVKLLHILYWLQDCCCISGAATQLLWKRMIPAGIYELMPTLKARYRFGCLAAAAAGLPR